MTSSSAWDEIKEVEKLHLGGPNMVVAYEELVDFLAAGTTPQAIVHFSPSERTKARVSELLALQKSASLTPEDLAELNHYLEVEHIMRLAKARAWKHLGGSP